MNFISIMLNEISYSQKDRYCMILLIWGPSIGKFIKTEGRIKVTTD